MTAVSDSGFRNDPAQAKMLFGTDSLHLHDVASHSWSLESLAFVACLFLSVLPLDMRIRGVYYGDRGDLK
jgi:hypothetical protein